MMGNNKGNKDNMGNMGNRGNIRNMENMVIRGTHRRLLVVQKCARFGTLWLEIPIGELSHVPTSVYSVELVCFFCVWHYCNSNTAKHLEPLFVRHTVQAVCLKIRVVEVDQLAFRRIHDHYSPSIGNRIAECEHIWR